MDASLAQTVKSRILPALSMEDLALEARPPLTARSQEQLRCWLEALGGKIEQLGVDAGNLRNRLASMQGTYITQAETMEQGPALARQEAFGLLVADLLGRICQDRKSC